MNTNDTVFQRLARQRISMFPLRQNAYVEDSCRGYVTVQIGDMSHRLFVNNTSDLFDFVDVRLGKACYWLTADGKPLRKQMVWSLYGFTKPPLVVAHARLSGGSGISASEGCVTLSHTYTQSDRIKKSDCGQRFTAVNAQRFLKKWRARKGDDDVSPLDLQGVSDFFLDLSEILDRFDRRAGFDIVSLIEDLVIFWFQCVRGRSLLDVSIAAMSFMKSRMGGNVSALRFAGSYLSSFIDELFEGLFVQSSDDDWESIKYVNDFRSFIEKWEQLRDCNIAKKYTRLLQFLIAFGCVERVGMEVSSETLKFCRMQTAQPFMHANFLYCVVDTVSYTLQRALLFAKTGEWSVFLHGPASYTKWFDACAKIRREAQLMGNLEAHGTTYFQFVSDLKNVIEEGKAIVRFGMKTDGYELSIAKKLLYEMLMVEATVITRKSTQQERQAPFGVLIFGGSSVAKSQFTKMLFYYFGKLFDLPTGDEYKYTRDPTQDFWTGFTSQVWCVQLDDIGFLRPDKAPADPSLTELIQICNNVPMSPNQAALEDKGKTPLRAKMVIATSNVKDLNANAYFQCPLAVQRRLPFVITVEPKREYARDDAPQMIDPFKIPLLTGDWPDLWEIRVDKVIPGGEILDRQMAGFETIARFSSTNKFLDWFKVVALEFERIQKKAMMDDTSMQNLKLCKECNRVVCVCAMAHYEEVSLAVQSGNRYLLPTGTQWGEEFVIVQNHGSEGHDHLFFELVRGEYVVTRTTYAGSGQMVSRTTSPTTVLRKPVVRESISREMYADVISEVLKVTGRRATTRTDRFIHGSLGRFVSWYIKYPRFRKFADYVMDLPFLRRLVIRVVDSSTAQNGYCRQTFEFIGNMRERMVINRSWALGVSVLSAVGISCLAYHKLSSKSKPTPAIQGLRTSVSDDFFPKTEKFNVWKKDDYETTTFDVDMRSVNFAALDVDHVAGIIRKNTCRIEIRGTLACGKPTRHPGNAFCVGGHLWVSNNHLFHDNGDLRVKFMVEPETEGASRNTEVCMRQEVFFRDEKNDLIWFELLAWEAKADLTNLIAKDSFNGEFRGYYTGYTREMIPRAMPLKAVYKFPMYEPTMGLNINYWKGTVPADTINGDCGTLLFTHSPNTVILGIHQLGGHSCIAQAVPLNQSLLAKARARFTRPLIQSAPPFLGTESCPKSIGPLKLKSAVRWLEHGTLAVFGTYTGFRAQPRSKVQPTLLGSIIQQQRGWEMSVGKPELNDWRPWRHALLDVTHQDHGLISPSILEKCVDSFSKDILKDLPVEELKAMQPISTKASINGIAGVDYIDKMNFNTSMGEPYCKKKKHFLEGVEHEKVFTPEVMALAQQCRERYAHGQRASPIFSGQLKDEPRALEKIQVGKIRVFTGSAVWWQIVVREQLLSTCRCIQRNKLAWEAAPGTVVQSLEWESFRDYLTQFGEDRIIAGDYGKFDKKMQACMILAAFDVIIRVLRAADWTEDQLLTIWCIAEDVAYSFVNFDGDLVMFYGSNPSGHPLTVIINCIVNSLYLRYCYHELNPLREVATFRANVKPITYGDDNAMGVQRSISWYNHTAIAAKMATIGVEYTMADKHSASVPFVSISDITFLKRAWRFDEDIGAWVGPLEEDSIKKMLCVCVKSKTLSQESHMVRVMLAACNEFFWYGKERFVKERTWLSELVVRADLEREMELIGGLPQWEDLHDRFWKASRGMQVKRIEGVCDGTRA